MSQEDKGVEMRKRAQSLIEYTVLIAVTAAALVSMQVYMKRAISGKLRTQAAQVSGGGFYSPGATVSDQNITKNITEHSYSDKFIQTSESESMQRVNTSEQVLSFAAEPERF